MVHHVKIICTNDNYIPTLSRSYLILIIIMRRVVSMIHSLKEDENFKIVYQFHRYKYRIGVYLDSSTTYFTFI